MESPSVRSSCLKTLSRLSGLVLSRTQVSVELGLYLWISLHIPRLDLMTMVSFKVKKILFFFDTVPSPLAAVSGVGGILVSPSHSNPRSFLELLCLGLASHW